MQVKITEVWANLTRPEMTEINFVDKRLFLLNLILLLDCDHSGHLWQPDGPLRKWPTVVQQSWRLGGHKTNYRECRQAHCGGDQLHRPGSSVAENTAA